MKKEPIIHELKRIKVITNMRHKELYEKFPFTRDYLEENESVFPVVTGLIESELEHLIRRIEKNELR